MSAPFRRKYTDKLTGKKCLTAKYYGDYTDTDADGVRRRVPLSKNRAASQQMLNELTRKAELARAGVLDPFDRHRSRPLANHVADWEATLRTSDAGDKHVRQVTGCVRHIVEGCDFRLLSDISSSRVQTFLGSLRTADSGEVPADREWYSREELARLLGVKVAAVSSLVARHRLAGDGDGRARRYPRATAETLLKRSAKGYSPKAINMYLAAVKQFTRWLVFDRRLPANPLEHLTAASTTADRQRNRHPLAGDELERLIVAATGSARTFRGLTGGNRAMLYRLAASTGFRAEELASLRPGVFDLQAERPTVTLAGAAAKNGKTAVQPLTVALVGPLGEYLANRPSGRAVWSGNWYRRAADMIRIDLDAASIPYVVAGPDGERFADFHNLRHTFVALLDKSGATLKEAT